MNGLDLRLVNPKPSVSSITQIINGRRTHQSTYTYSMRLTALKEGTQTLGPITVVADGRTYRTEPQRITVRKTAPPTGTQGDRYVFAELDVTPRSLFVTQTYVATLTFGIRKVEIDGLIYAVDMLRRVLDLNASQLSVFAQGRAQRSERWLTDSSGKRHRYEVFRVVQNIRAEDVGEVLIGPIFLKANYPTRVRRGFFGSMDVTRHRKEIARTEGIRVTVNAPPEEGRPDDYTGAIGRFSMTVSAKPTRVEQGQPITLTLSIKGSPQEGVAGPDLTRHPELASRFDYTKDELIGDIEGGAKVFRRAIFPKQAGEQTVPPISWSYFDPIAKRYVTRESPAIDIVVDPRTDSGMTIALPDASALETGETKLTVLTGGIAPNFADADIVLADQSFTLTTPWLVSLIVSPAAWLVITLVSRHRMRLRQDADLARRGRARRGAYGRIKQAMRNGHPPQQISALADAVTQYVSDRYGLGTGTLTPKEVKNFLECGGADGTLVNEVVTFLESCDTVRYTPGAAETPSPTRAVANVRRWINQIEGSRP